MTERHPCHVLLPQQAPTLRRRALKLTSNEHRAKDLVQDTFLKASANRDSYRPDARLRAWLFTILRNTFYSGWRKFRREVEDVDDACAKALVEEPRQDHALARSELMDAIALLPHAQRRPLVPMGAYGFSQLEAADACGCTLGTIKSRVNRSRAALSRILAHDAVARSDRTPRPRRPLRQSGPDRTEPVAAPMAARRDVTRRSRPSSQPKARFCAAFQTRLRAPGPDMLPIPDRKPPLFRVSPACAASGLATGDRCRASDSISPILPRFW